MLNNEKYLGIETNFITEKDVEKCIREQIKVSAKVVEYDLMTKAFTIRICERIKGILHIEGLTKNTAASYVGRIINVFIASKEENGVCICAPLHCEDSETILKRYKPNTKLICRVNVILGYGAILEDIRTGAYALLHISEIQKKYNVKHASEVFSIGQILEDVYINNTVNGIQFSFSAKDSEDNAPKAYKFLDFLKDRILA